jgi:hypothetical protein
MVWRVSSVVAALPLIIFAVTYPTRRRCGTLTSEAEFVIEPAYRPDNSRVAECRTVRIRNRRQS